ncbi:MAG: DNA polymerase, partial [Paraclostridium sp.]
IDIKNGEAIPKFVVDAIYDENIIKAAFNANFERLCLSKYFNKDIPINKFRCTMVNALYLGLPSSLEKLGNTLNLHNKKISEGKNLINIFCKPNKTHLKESKNLWQDFKNYCKRDVEVERSIRNIFKNYPLTNKELNLWFIDQDINDRGILIDEKLIDKCLQLNELNNNILRNKLEVISNIKNPKSTKEVKAYLEKEFGFYIDSLNVSNVNNILNSNVDEGIKEVLKLRKEICKTSLKKFDAMKKCVCRDNRIRGLLQFYGANRTGRWAGRLVQVHNLPQNKYENLSQFRNYIRNHKEEFTTVSIDDIENNFGKVSELLPQLIRTAFIPSINNKFIIADFSAIEARIIAWISGEKWRNEVFKTHGKIYEASAARMFKVAIEEIKPGSDLRQKGKIAELALGYQGGRGALLTMGADKMGLEEVEIDNLVKSFRKENPNIVRLWKEIEKAAIYVVENKCSYILNQLEFFYERGILFIKLPSGRCLSYIRPRIEQGEFGKKLSYEGVNQTTKNFERIYTYGGKLSENIVQAIARDCLGEVILNLENKGFNIVMHVHDEVVIEGCHNMKDIKNIMERNISWAKGLCLKADLFESDFYKKG